MNHVRRRSDPDGRSGVRPAAVERFKRFRNDHATERRLEARRYGNRESGIVTTGGQHPRRERREQSSRLTILEAQRLSWVELLAASSTGTTSERPFTVMKWRPYDHWSSAVAPGSRKSRLRAQVARRSVETGARSQNTDHSSVCRARRILLGVAGIAAMSPTCHADAGLMV